ncbi:MAG: YidC/Oxa1 family membrane protein insertase [Candidatus Peribacteraceae bacterium]|jgi:YidC/Oxa1 family membrane protein insertase
MAAPQRKSNFLQFALIFLIVYLGSQFVMRQFFPAQQDGANGARPPVELTAGNVRAGNNPAVTVKNHSTVAFTLSDRCPLPSVDLHRINAGTSGKTLLTSASDADSASPTAIPCTPPPPVPAQGEVKLDLSPWKYSLLGEVGTYEAELTLPQETTDALRLAQTGATVQETLTARFSVTEPGFFTKIFRTFIMAPFLNFLIFAGSWLPGHNLGLAIILLTLVVKLLLFLPTQHALEGQKKMQMLQPKLDELKKRFNGDAQRIQAETMKLWKEHKVNPFQSCLPTLVQFPILIGLFYVIRDGSVLALSGHLIYPFYQNLNWTFDTFFLGLDLLKPNVYIMPPLLVLLQFLQMKLTFAIADRKKKNSQAVIDVKPSASPGAGKDKEKDPLSQTELQQKIFQYALPLMIGFFALQFPSAVSLYWGISTLFAIGQQMIVNREHLRV